MVGFINSVFMEAPRLTGILQRARCRSGRARSPGRDRYRVGCSGLVEFRRRLVFLRRQAAGYRRFILYRAARPDHRIGRSAPAPANRPRSRCCTAPSIRSPAFIRIDGMDVRGLTLTRAAAEHRRRVPGSAVLFNRSIADNLRVGKPDASEEGDADRGRSAPRRSNSSSAADLQIRHQCLANADACCPVASGSGLSIARALSEGSADPHPRRSHQRRSMR